MSRKPKLPLPKLPTKAQFRAWARAEIRRRAKALPRETRQAILDAVRAGGVSLKGIADAHGTTVDAVCGVINMNMQTVRILRQETV